MNWKKIGWLVSMGLMCLALVAVVSARIEAATNYPDNINPFAEKEEVVVGLDAFVRIQVVENDGGFIGFAKHVLFGSLPGYGHELQPEASPEIDGRQGLSHQARRRLQLDPAGCLADRE